MGSDFRELTKDSTKMFVPLNKEAHPELLLSRNIKFIRNVPSSKVTNKLKWPYLAVYGLIPLILSTLVGWILVPEITKRQILNRFALSPSINKHFYDAWIHPSFPVYFKVYVFNVTNADEIIRGELPKFNEIGPYIFTENKTKVNLVHDNVEDTATYSEYLSYQFEPELSGNFSLKDKITIINVPYIVAATKISGLPWPMNELGKTLLLRYKESIFVERTIEEALFKGWKVPFAQSFEEDIGLSLMPNNTFSYFYMQNDSIQGPYTISRGIKTRSSLGLVLKYRNKTTLDFWGEPSTPCNQLKGTDGTIFPSFLSKSARLNAFIPEICRPLEFTFLTEIPYGGVQAYRFTARELIQSDPFENKDNYCYCEHSLTNPEKCLRRGTFDIGNCRDGAPIALSCPHFLDAEEEYVEKSGLKPDREKHETFVDIEPKTGVVYGVSKKVQINLILKRVQGISSMKRVPEMPFPLAWADECAVTGKSLTGPLEGLLTICNNVEYGFKWVFTSFTFCLTVGIWICKTYRKPS